MSVVYTNYALNASKPMVVSIQIDASGNDRKVILSIPVEDNNPFPITATFDPTGVNVAMTEITDGLLSNTADSQHVRFFFIDESSLPASAGTYDISCSWTGTNSRTLLSVISCNGMVTGQPRAVNTNEATAASTLTTTIASVSTDIVFDGFNTSDPSATQTPGAGQTSIIVDTSGPSSSYSTGNTSHSWTDPDSGSWDLFLAVSAWEAAPTGIEVSLPTALETDTAIAFSKQKSKDLPIALETDTAITITLGSAAISIALPVATETNTAIDFSKEKIYVLPIVLETDAAQAFGSMKEYSLPIANETDTAVGFGRNKVYVLPITNETDSAQLIALVKQYSLPVATEVDTAVDFAQGGGITIVLPPALESNLAIDFGKEKRQNLNSALGVDSVIDLIIEKSYQFDPALESDTAIALGKTKGYPLSSALETDTAVIITRAGGGGLSPEDIQAILDALFRDPRFLVWGALREDFLLR